jgi:hypothetical protein
MINKISQLFHIIKRSFPPKEDHNILRIKEIDKEHGISVKLVVKHIPEDRKFKLYCKRKNVIAEIHDNMRVSRSVEQTIEYYSRPERYYNLRSVDGDLKKLKKNDLLEVVEDDISEQTYTQYITNKTIGRFMIYGCEIYKNEIDKLIENFDDLGTQLQIDYKQRRNEELSEKAQNNPIFFKTEFLPNGYIKISTLSECWFIKDNEIITDIQHKKYPPPRIIREPNEIPRPRR